MAAVADIALLNGDPLDHMGTVSGLTCGGGKILIGSTGASCNDGTVTWTATAQGLTQQPECIGESAIVYHLLFFICSAD